MKTTLLPGAPASRTFIIMLTALMFFVGAHRSFCQLPDVTVHGLVTSDDPGYSSSGNINICSYHQTLRTTIENNGAPISPFDLYVMLPTNSSINTTPLVNCNNAVISLVSGSQYKFAFTTLPNTSSSSCIIEVDFYVPCNIQPVGGPYPYPIAYSCSTFCNLIQDPTFFYINIIKPQMVIENFWSDDVVPQQILAPPAGQDMLVSNNRHRTFDLHVTGGMVESLQFIYQPEDEIVPLGFTLQLYNYNTNSPLSGPVNSNWTPQPNTTNTFQIDAGLFPSLFANSAPYNTKILSTQSIRVEEIFKVVACSSPPAPALASATNYSVTWSCPSVSATCDLYGPVTRNIWVQKSPGSMSGGLLGFYNLNSNTPQVNLDICGIIPSDMVMQFSNNNHSTANHFLVGSAMKRLHKITYALKNDDVTYDNVLFEGMNTANTTVFSINVTNIPNFYTLNNNLVTLNFDVLSSSLYATLLTLMVVYLFLIFMMDLK